MVFGRRKKDNQPYIKDQKDSSNHFGNVKPVNGIKAKLFGWKKKPVIDREDIEKRKYAKAKGITIVAGKPLEEVIDYMSLDTLRILNGDEPVTQMTDKVLFPEGSKVHPDFMIKEDEGVVHGGILSADKTKWVGFKNLSEGDKKWWREKYAKLGLDFDKEYKKMQKK